MYFLLSHGQRLVIVACQEARNVALAGVAKAALLESLAINSYIVLERIGRSREHGEATQGKFGLSRLKIPPKSAFYFRKSLLADGLIVKQVFLQKFLERCASRTNEKILPAYFYASPEQKCFRNIASFASLLHIEAAQTFSIDQTASSSVKGNFASI